MDNLCNEPGGMIEVVLQEKRSLLQGRQVLSVAVATLPAGQYFVEIWLQQQRTVLPFTKQ